MNLLNFSREQLNNGTLNNMLEEVGIDDVNNSTNMIQGAMNAYWMFSNGQGSSSSGGFNNYN